PHKLLNQLLAGRTILTACQFCHSLCKRRNDFVGVNRVWLASCRRILGKKIIDQFDHHAMKARPFFVISLVWHECSILRRRVATGWIFVMYGTCACALSAGRGIALLHLDDKVRSSSATARLSSAQVKGA